VFSFQPVLVSTSAVRAALVGVEEPAAQPRDAATEAILRWVEYAATGIELLAVAIIVTAILVATVVYLYRLLSRRADETTYARYRHGVARALVLALEILVAADIIRTVALEPSVTNVAILGLLVLIRTFLSWSLVVEIEERWPWQAPRLPEETERRVESRVSPERSVED
jgi:uncharacterized membrane protein